MPLNFDVTWFFKEMLNLDILITHQIAPRGTSKIMFKILQRKLFMNYNLSELKQPRYPVILEGADWADTTSSYKKYLYKCFNKLFLYLILNK